MTMGVARALAKRGLARGDRVAILSANRAEYLAAYYGIMRAGLVAVPVNYKFPRETIHFIIADAGAKLVFCDRARRDDCPAGSAGRVLRRRRAPRASTASSIPARSRPSCPTPDEPAMFLYTSGSTGTPKGVVLSHQSHIWVVETRLAPGPRPPPLSDRGAALSHERAGARQARLRRARHHRAAAAVRGARLYRGDRPLSRDLAHRGAADDRHDAARDATLLARTDLSSVEFIRMGSAPVSASLMAGDPSRAAAGRGHQRLWHDRSRAGGVRPASRRACRSRRCRSAIRIRRCSCAWSTATTATPTQGVLEMKCPAVMNGYHNRPDVPPPITAGRLLHHRRRVPPRRRTASIISSAAPTTCSSPAARTSIRPTSSACWSAIPTWRRPRWCRSTTRSRAEAGRLRHPEGRPQADRGRRSSNSRSPTRRPISTRASSGSSTNCRSPRPTRSTARRCASSRRSASRPQRR